MSRNLVRPYFPIPPGEYQQPYFAEIIRAFSNHLSQMQNPGEGRNTGMVFTNLQTDDVGLEPGAVFQQDGILKISLLDQPNVRGNSSTTSVGSVTVTIT